MPVVPVDAIEGLNLLLGGGIPTFKRHSSFEGESATLVVRGPPGSGKTVFGMQLAGSLARSRGCDVAYGCVELLPSELAVQHDGIKRADAQEFVVQAPFAKKEPKTLGCRIFAGMLALGSAGEEVSRLAESVDALLGAVRESGGDPRVLVVDSLSDGYNLGASAPRALADDLCKMAARRGLALIFLEETVDSKPSAWSFAADVVIRLSPSEEQHATGTQASAERGLTVAKNRFGPSEPGVHRFSILPNFGIRVLPAPHAYLSKWAPRVVLPDWRDDYPPTQGWSVNRLPDTWPQFRDCVTTVYGADPVRVRRVASNLGQRTVTGDKHPGSDVFLEFNRNDAPISPQDMQLGGLLKLGCGDPYLSGDWLLATVIASMNELRAEKKLLRRVLVGDLQSLRSFSDPEAVRHALGVLVAILRRLRVPAILFETAPPTMAPTAAVPAQQPRSVDFADVVFELQSGEGVAVVSHARWGQRERVDV